MVAKMRHRFLVGLFLEILRANAFVAPRTRVATTIATTHPQRPRYYALPIPNVDVMRILSNQASTTASPSATVTEDSLIDGLVTLIKWYFLGFGGALALAVAALIAVCSVFYGLIGDVADSFFRVMATEHPELHERLKEQFKKDLLDENGYLLDIEDPVIYFLSRNMTLMAHDIYQEPVIAEAVLAQALREAPPRLLEDLTETEASDLARTMVSTAQDMFSEFE